MTYTPLELQHAWEVLLLFIVPIGGGIPAGVVLAAKYGFSWTEMSLLYLVSDVLLACAFEPLMLWFLRASELNPKLAKMRTAFAESTNQMVGKWGVRPGPFTLIVLTFGTDPMTGRSIAKAVGHGFFTGWFLVIIGDFLFFAVIAASTLLLNNILGDGTWAALIITAALIGVPMLIRRLRGGGPPISTPQPPKRT